MISLMSENRRHAVAQIIIPRGPITVAKNAYNMRLGVYGFGFTTNNQIPSLFQYAMVWLNIIFRMQKRIWRDFRNRWRARQRKRSTIMTNPLRSLLVAEAVSTVNSNGTIDSDFLDYLILIGNNIY